MTLSGSISSSSINIVNNSWFTPSSTSSRTGGPKRRSKSSCSRLVKRSSESSSSISKSWFRVTRNVRWPTISIPGKSCSRFSAIKSSRGMNRVECSVVGIKRLKIGGTFTRAKNFSLVSGLITRTPKLRDRPEMYGNGCDGSTANGVSTGKMRALKRS